MQRTMRVLIGGLLVVLAGAGCEKRGHVEVYEDEHYDGYDDYDFDDHVCTARCNHYYDDDAARFIVVRHHHHGPGCGHVLYDRHWVVVREGHGRRPRPVAHVCTRECHHHYYDGTRIVELRRHRHGPGCGHAWDGRRWVMAPAAVGMPAGHVCTRACHEHCYEAGKVVVLAGHRHDRQCGHVWNGSYWVAARQPVAAIPARHVCTRNCANHVFDGTRVVVLEGHRHGPDCGHVWKGRYWLRQPASIRQRP